MDKQKYKFKAKYSAQEAVDLLADLINYPASGSDCHQNYGPSSLSMKFSSGPHIVYDISSVDDGNNTDVEEVDRNEIICMS